MNSPDKLLVFELDGQRYALRLSSVQRVIPAVEVTRLPHAPEIVLGVIDLRGEVLPVVNVRRRFRLPEREIDLGDRFIIARTSRRSVALVADATAGVIEAPNGQVVTSDKILPHLNYVEGVVKLADGIVLIHDIDEFLSLEEVRTLDGALEDQREAG